MMKLDLHSVLYSMARNMLCEQDPKRALQVKMRVLVTGASEQHPRPFSSTSGDFTVVMIRAYGHVSCWLEVEGQEIWQFVSNHDTCWRDSLADACRRYIRTVGPKLTVDRDERVFLETFGIYAADFEGETLSTIGTTRVGV